MDNTAHQYIVGDCPDVPWYEYEDSGQPSEVLPLEAFRTAPGTKPEKSRLALPSVFPAQYLESLGLSTLRRQELELRRGQANDALHNIRMAIGQKSFQYTTNMRAGEGSTGVKTRSRTVIQDLGRTIAAHRRIYYKSRMSMIDLGIDKEELNSTYRNIEDKDVQTDTTIHDPNRPGAAKEHLSWIFTVGRPQLTESSYMEECVFFSLSLVSILKKLLDYRVHWLRARAQSNRWAEELKLTHNEMSWVARFFSFKYHTWENCKNTAIGLGDPGSVAYAERQMHFWYTMARKADLRFRGVNTEYISITH